MHIFVQKCRVAIVQAVKIWLPCWVLMGLLLAAGAVRAEIYVFTGVVGENWPIGCDVDALTGKKSCSSIDLPNASSILTLGDDITVNGDITGAGNCNITMGHNVTVTGKVFGSTGITVAGNNFKALSVQSSTGSITVGDDAVIDHFIYATDGDVKLGLRADVEHRLTASASAYTGIMTSTGKITLGDISKVYNGGITSSTGDITLGQDSHVYTGGVTSSTGDILVNKNTIVKGNVTSSTGSITLDKNIQVVFDTAASLGDVKATTGIINIGDFSVIEGGINKGNPSELPPPSTPLVKADYSIYLGQKVKVKGTFTTSDCLTFVGNDSSVAGSINNGKTGNVTLGERVRVGGSITVVTGSIYIGPYSQVLGMSTAETGDVNVGDYARVVSNATTTTGSIDVGTWGQVCGDVTTVTGEITVADYGKVSQLKNGAVVKVTTGKVAKGAVTFGNFCQVGGNIDVTTGSIMFGDSGWVAGTIALTTVDTVTGGVTFHDDGRVKGNIGVPAPAVTNLQFGKNFQYPDLSLVVSSVCDEIFPPVVVVSKVPGAFECTEKGATYNNLTATPTGRNALYTKLAAAAFAFDVVALKTDGTLESSYVVAGDAAKNVTLDLVDSSAVGCAALPSLSGVVPQTLSFTGAETTLGRTTSAALTVGNAYANLRCRVTDANQTVPVVACSSDSFAVRPSSATLLTSAFAPAPSVSATPAFKAGAPFTLRATTSPSYTGTLTLYPAKLTSQNPAVVGDLTPTALVANAVAAAATYSEVGYVYLAPGAYRDDTFTAVDSAAGDCITDATNDNYLSATLASSGKYGCSIGNATAVSLGRFYPDHFALISSPFTPACGTFSYMGQPLALSATIEAQNLAGTLTKNFSGAFAMATVAAQLANANNGVALDGARLTDQGSPAWALGAYTFVAKGFARGAAPDGPFDNLSIGLQVISNDIALATAAQPQLVNRNMSATDPTCIADPSNCTAVSLVQGAKLRYGRIKLKNAYGSERQELKIPLVFEYWTSQGWQSNPWDSCTKLVSNNFSVTFPTSAKNSLVACNSALTVTGSAPAYTLSLSKPSTGKTGWADLTLNLGATPAGTQCSAVPSPGLPISDLATSPNMPTGMPWLQTNGANPSARATFGVFKSPLIYRRENY